MRSSAPHASSGTTRDAWNKVVEQAMTKDFSWTRSADEYIKLYLELAGDTEVMPEPVSTPEPAP